MKTRISILPILSVLILLGSCAKEQNVNTPIEQTDVQHYTLTIGAKKVATKALNASMEAYWDEGEVVKVYKAGVAIGELSPVETGEESTTLSGTITGSVSPGDELTLRCGGGFENQKGTLEDLSKNHDNAEATLTVDSIDGTKIIPEGENVVFDNIQAIVGFSLSDGKNAISATNLTIYASSGDLSGASGGVLEITPDSATSTFYVALHNSSSADYFLTATTATKTYIFSKSDVTFEDGHFYPILVKMTAPAVYTVAGSAKDGETYPETGDVAVFGKAWAADRTSNDMVVQPDGTYVKEYSTTSAYELKYKITVNHSWDESYPASDQQVTTYGQTGGAGTLKIVYDPSDNSVSHSMSPDYYTVAGTNLGVTAWAINATNNMAGSGGWYSKMFSNQTAGTTYSFKVVKNYSFENSNWGWWNGDCSYTLPAGETSFTVSLNPSIPSIKVTPESANLKYVVAGTSGIFGSDFNPDDDDNKMTMQGDGTYSLSIHRDWDYKSKFYFKVVKNGSWDNGSWPSSNYECSESLITKAGTLTITFNPTSTSVNATFTAD